MRPERRTVYEKFLPPGIIFLVQTNVKKLSDSIKDLNNVYMDKNKTFSSHSPTQRYDLWVNLFKTVK